MATTSEVLRHGELEVEGRLVVASNLSVLATARLDGVAMRCIYKPIAGERPLWDFPDGTLAAREVAAYEVSRAAGWDLVPTTVLRADGPLGAGMCQEWIDQDDGDAPWVDVVAPDAMPVGMLPVLEAVDGDGLPVLVVHRDAAALRRLAVFDVVVNNADRKGGHILHGRRSGAAASDDVVAAVDHGVSFHTEPKLRTVLWGWAGEPLTGEERRSLKVLRTTLAADGALHATLSALVNADEVEAVATRLDDLLAAGELPQPHGRMPVPWPVL